jgi:quinohemoprotein ethanol dehydrogenase
MQSAHCRPRRDLPIKLASAALVLLLSGGCQRTADPATASVTVAANAIASAAVDDARIANSAAEPGQWLLPGRDRQGSYFSPLRDINAGNVAQLGFAWHYKLGTHRGLEGTPLVIDGVMYASGNFGRVYALDAATGRELWTYDPLIDGAWARHACCDAINRGVVAYRGRIYVGALDGWLHALDARTGKLVWKVDTVVGRQQHKPYTLSGAPLLAHNAIVIGNAGADFAGTRGYVSSYDPDTGALRWRFYTVPHDPAEGPQEQAHLQKAVATWDPRHRWAAGVGGNVWDGMAYDPALNLVYVGTGNAAPYNSHLDGRKGGDELYAAAIVAIHADSGELAWYYQTVPGDRWDFDSTQKLILADLQVAGSPRAVIMQAAKNGYYYVLDRATGKLLSAHNFAFVSWTRGIDQASGRPIPDPSASYDRGPALVFPSEAGAHSWQPMAFDAEHGVTYIPVIEAGNVIVETAHRPAGLVEGQFSTPAIATEDYDPKSLRSLFGELPPFSSLASQIGKHEPASRGVLRAWSVAEQRVLWEAPTATAWDGGVLATAGGLVFQGDANGKLNAYAADTGKRLAAVEVGSSMMAGPITYRVNGTQYIAIMAGYGGSAVITGAPLDPASAAYRYGNEGRIIVLRLGGPAPPLPPLVSDAPIPDPPARPTDGRQIAAGEVLYNRYCARCHLFGRGILPDLRRMSAATHSLFSAIVLGGAYNGKGMGRFDDVLSAADLGAIHAYVVDEAWRLKEQNPNR